MAKYHQGFFKPLNPDKYAGDPKDIRYRSAWELRCMRKFDCNPNVLTWTSETIEIPYRSPLDLKYHRYYPDFVISKLGSDGKRSIVMIEVKPAYQARKPVKTEKMTTRRYLVEMATWGVNEAKWVAARAYCAQRGWAFKVISEKELGIK